MDVIHHDKARRTPIAVIVLDIQDTVNLRHGNTSMAAAKLMFCSSYGKTEIPPLNASVRDIRTILVPSKL